MSPIGQKSVFAIGKKYENMSPIGQKSVFAIGKKYENIVCPLVKTFVAREHNAFFVKS